MSAAAPNGRRVSRGSAALVAAAALGANGAAAALAAGRFAPVADGVYYQAIARRVAAGEGYTWVFPGGETFHAGHYPVGYPAALGALQALFGPSPAVAAGLAAGLGVLGALAARALGRAAFASERAGLFAGLAVALHPALLAYVPATMTEGITADLVLVVAWLAERARAGGAWLGGLGVAGGLAAFVRPQTIVLAPALAWLAAPPAARPGGRGARAALVLALGLAVLSPWIARGHARMGRAAFVSHNAGWNLLIGTDPAAGGGWAPLETPPSCEGVWGEADKDACFGRAALERIRERPGAWLALAPRKLWRTFEYCGAGPWYLAASRPDLVPAPAKLVLGALETLHARAALALALLAVSSDGRRRRALGRLGALLALTPLGTAAWLLLGGLGVGARSTLARAAAVAVLSTALAHAVFFGAGRYSLPCLPIVAALAAAWLGAGRPARSGAPERVL